VEKKKGVGEETTPKNGETGGSTEMVDRAKSATRQKRKRGASRSWEEYGMTQVGPPMVGTLRRTFPWETGESKTI